LDDRSISEQRLTQAARPKHVFFDRRCLASDGKQHQRQDYAPEQTG
jgi:hypothetical protein